MWDPDHESLAPSTLWRLQQERLEALVTRLSEESAFYRTRLADAAPRVRAPQDLAALPFTTKGDLRRLYPLGLFAGPHGAVIAAGEPIELHCSSGTTGASTVVGYTRADLELWAEVMARTLAAGGVRRGDLVHNAYGYGLFTGGLGFHYGALRLGAHVLPVSSGNTARQVKLLRDLGATVLACTPSYALHLAEVAEEHGGGLSLRVGLHGAEPWSEGLRAEIQRRLGITASDVYGLSEIIGPGVAFECPARAGLHINEDHFLPEVIDPSTGEVLPDGRKGELVLTTLTKQATPLLRYRTGDLTALTHDPCACGRSLARMDRVCGRVDDMLVVRGVNVFPCDIEAVLTRIPELVAHYQLIVDRERAIDRLELQVETRDALRPDDAQGLVRRVGQAMREALGLGVIVTVLPPRQLPRSEGKALHVVDQRLARGA